MLATYPVRQWTGERPVDELTLYVYYKNGRESSILYEDAGEGYDYLDGAFSLKTWIAMGENGHFSLEQQQDGTWMPPYQKVKIYLVGFPTFVRQCSVDGVEMPVKEIRLRDRALYTLNTTPDFKLITWNA